MIFFVGSGQKEWTVDLMDIVDVVDNGKNFSLSTESTTSTVTLPITNHPFTLPTSPDSRRTLMPWV